MLRRERLIIVVSNLKSIIEAKILEYKEENLEVERVFYRKNIEELIKEVQAKTNLDLFGGRKIIIINNLERLKDKEIEELINYLKFSSLKLILTFVSEETPFWLKKLDKEKIVYHLENIQLPKFYYENKLIETLRDFFKRQKIDISPNLLKVLIENYKDNLDELFQEITKTIYLPDIKEDEFLQLFRLKANIFTLQEALFKKNWFIFSRHFYKYCQEAKSSDEIFRLINFLEKSLRIIYFLKHSLKETTAEVNYYYLIRLKKYSSYLKEEEIKRLFRILADFERDLKKFKVKFTDAPSVFLTKVLEARI